jgi:sporulation protein YlmC with PRC-barrel domain
MTPEHSGMPDRLVGKEVISDDGQRVAAIEDVFLDEQTGKPEFVRVKMGILGRREVLIPLADSELRDDGLHVPFSEDCIKESPHTEGDYLPPEAERDLYAHYGVSFESPSLLNEARGRPGDRLQRAEPSPSPLGEAPAANVDSSPLIPEEKMLERRAEPQGYRLRRWVPGAGPR